MVAIVLSQKELKRTIHLDYWPRPELWVVCDWFGTSLRLKFEALLYHQVQDRFDRWRFVLVSLMARRMLVVSGVGWRGPAGERERERERIRF